MVNAPGHLVTAANAAVEAEKPGDCASVAESVFAEVTRMLTFLCLMLQANLHSRLHFQMF
jgi:hypothetical protein